MSFLRRILGKKNSLEISVNEFLDVIGPKKPNQFKLGTNFYWNEYFPSVDLMIEDDENLYLLVINDKEAPTMYFGINPANKNKNVFLYTLNKKRKIKKVYELKREKNRNDLNSTVFKKNKNLSLKEIKKGLLLNLESIISEDLSDEEIINLKSKNKNKSVSFSIYEGNQLNRDHIIFNFDIEFEINRKIDKTLYNYLIPFQRARMIFNYFLSENIIEKIDHFSVDEKKIKFTYTISFNKEIDNHQRLIDFFSDFLEYNYRFILLHNSLLNKGNQLKSCWKTKTKEGDYSINQIKPIKTENIQILTIPFFKDKNPIIYFIVDYKSPEGLNNFEKNHLFPIGRLDSGFRLSFPNPNPYTKGYILNEILPFEINEKLPHKEEEWERKIYQMNFNQISLNQSRLNLIVDKAQRYITEFIKLHYDFYKIKIKNNINRNV